jgi:hypothetical protein
MARRKNSCCQRHVPTSLRSVGGRLARSVDTESEMTVVAGVAAIRVDEEEPVEHELRRSSSSRPVDRQASAIRAAVRMCMEKSELHDSEPFWEGRIS